MSDPDEGCCQHQRRSSSNASYINSKIDAVHRRCVVCDCSNPYPVIVTVAAIFHANELLNGLTEIRIHLFVVLAYHVQVVNITLRSSLFHLKILVG